MNFLYPTFLFGLFAIAIPIIIHLFNFHRPKRVLFTNVQFLKDVKETTSSKLKLKHLLILLARICFILFLVLTFAQPFLKSKNEATLKGQQLVSIYLDNSYSMQNEIDKEKSLDVAIKAINRLTEIYPSNTEYYLLTNDFEGKDQYFRNKDKLNERLTEIKFSNTFREAEPVYKRELQTVARTDIAANNHIFWFSDFQKSTIGDLGKLPLDTSSKIYLAPVTGEGSSNVYVDSIWLKSPLVKADQNDTLEVQLKNEGERAVKDLVLKLYIDDVQVSTGVVSIEANGTFKTRFVFNTRGQGQKKCRISFEDFPVSFDNDYYFVLNISPKIRVLHLFDKASRFIPDVYGNETIFSFQSSSIRDFDHSLLSSSDLIVLDGITDIPVSLDEGLKDFVKKGGSLFIYPSPELNVESYNKLLASLYVPRIGKNNVDTHGADSSYRKASNALAAPDFNNPFFKGLFEKTDKNMYMPFAFPVINWGKAGEALLKLKNEEPVLSLFQADKGKVYLSAVPLEEKFTSLPNHSVFVLVMYKTAFNSITQGERLAYSFQEPAISVDLENSPSENIFSLSSGNFSVIPGQRLSGRHLVLEVPADQMRPGFYELKSNNKAEKILAFNYGKEESRQQFYNPEELKNIFSGNRNVQIYKAENADDFISKFKKDNIGIPLWKYSLILCLLFLALEILLIRFL